MIIVNFISLTEDSELQKYFLKIAGQNKTHRIFTGPHSDIVTFVLTDYTLDTRRDFNMG